MTEQPTESDKDYEAPDMRGRPGRLATEESSRITRRITLLAVVIGLFFAISKYFLWNETHSVSVLSSLVHSALDISGALSSFIAVRYAARPPDKNYRFGRGKAESFAAVFQVFLIVIAAFHLFETAVMRLMDPQPIEHSAMAIAFMLLYIILTVWLLIAQSWAIRATGSIAVRGDRAHYTADMIANAFVIIGIVLTSYLHLERADAWVGILMALWLLWTGYKVAQLAWAQLMDKELPVGERDMITHLAMQNPSVVAVHDLRTRAAGPYVFIQMRLELDPDLTLAQSHDVVVDTENRIKQQYRAADILIYPHPAGCNDVHGAIEFADKGKSVN